MYYFSLDTILMSCDKLKDCIPSKFIGLLSLLKSIDTHIVQPNMTYQILDAEVGNLLNDMMLMEETTPIISNSTLYVRFAVGWEEYVSDSMFVNTPNLYPLLIFLYKFIPFQNQPTKEELLQRFVSDFHLSMSSISRWFEKGNVEMSFAETCVTRNSIKNALNLPHATLTFDSSQSVKAKPSELSRAPFIQTLYAGMDGMRCLLLSRVNLENLYPSNELSKVVNLNTKIPHQVIHYGAPGTGKSYRIKEFLNNNNVLKENIFRTTFHPDSDYSTFVGAYKPAMKNLYRYNDSGIKITYKDDDDLAQTKKSDPIVDKVIEYAFVPQAFLNAYVRAYQTAENVYLIIEEINRGNCAQIFGDLFQLLDRNSEGKSDYTIKADTDIRAYLEEKLGPENEGIRDGELCLPANLYILATMNTSDQSLFPIDSAFKRRWDWEYEPIKYEDRDWQIIVGDKEYSWVSFQKEINKRIFDITHSEDKMLGDYFVNPHDGIITEKMLLNKVLFYLWNDVCKDGEGDIFKTSETQEVTFSELHGDEGQQKMIQMMEALEVQPLHEAESDTEVTEEH